MPRLIDADALLEGRQDHEMISTHLIWNAQTIDLVRCSDCRFRYGSSCTRFAEIPVTPEDYCSRGKKK